MHVFDKNQNIPNWEVAGLYLVFVFKKKGKFVRKRKRQYKRPQGIPTYADIIKVND